MVLKRVHLPADPFPMSTTAEQVTDGHWTKLALCAGHPERGAWFADDPQSIAKAVAICRVCPVSAECLNYALTTGPSEGVWGGTTPTERRRIARGAWRAR